MRESELKTAFIMVRSYASINRLDTEYSVDSENIYSHNIRTIKQIGHLDMVGSINLISHFVATIDRQIG